MENYSPNRNTPSRNFYVNELKKNSKNLTKKDDKLDFFENKLQKLLDINYDFFHPFFKDQEEPTNTNLTHNNFKENTPKRDKGLEEKTTLWKGQVIDSLINIYHNTVRSKIITTLSKSITNTVYPIIKLISIKQH